MFFFLDSLYFCGNCYILNGDKMVMFFFDVDNKIVGL